MPRQLECEYYMTIEPMIPVIAAAPKRPVHDVTSRRVAINTLLSSSCNNLPDMDDVKEIEYQFTTKDGQNLSIYFHQKKTSQTFGGLTSAIHYCHGGGMILGGVQIYRGALINYTSNTGVPFFAAEYRVAPQHPHPTPVEDCYAGLLWLQEHHKDFNIVLSRVGVMGDSAGGGLAAGVALMARDCGLSPPLAKQILIYPMLDDRTTTPDKTIEQLVSWSYDDNITGWTALLGQKIDDDDVSPYAPFTGILSGNTPEGYPWWTPVDIGYEYPEETSETSKL